MVYRCHDVKLKIRPNYASMWRYSEMLAIRPPQVVSYGEGLTPVVKVNGVLCKLENRNPTGTYADRASSVIVSVMRRKTYRVKYESDFAYSLAFYAKLAGSEISVVAEPEELDPQDIIGIASLGGSLEFRGKPELQYENPLSVEGLKTIAFELVESSPNVERVYVPSSSGLLAFSIAEGLNELEGVPPVEVIAVVVKGSPLPSFLGFSRTIKIVEIEPEEVINGLVRLARRGFYIKFLAASAYAYASTEERGVALISGGIRKPQLKRPRSLEEASLKRRILDVLSRGGGLSAYEIWKETPQFTLRGVYSALKSLEAEGSVCARYKMRGRRKIRIYELCGPD
jgi:hypothetical protein